MLDMNNMVVYLMVSHERQESGSFDSESHHLFVFGDVHECVMHLHCVTHEIRQFVCVVGRLGVWCGLWFGLAVAGQIA
jgi:hypothetical protein